MLQNLFSKRVFFLSLSRRLSFAAWLGLLLTLLATALGAPAIRASDGAGNGLDFDGFNDYVNIANESNFDFTNQMTVELWIKVDQFDRAWQAVITKGDDSWRVHRYSTSNNLAFGTNNISSPPDLQGNTNVNDGNWHHIAAVYSHSRKYLYVDGSLDASQPASGNLPNSDYPVYVGANAQKAGRNFDGQIDEVRVWDVALTPSEIRENMHRMLTGIEANLVAYWQLNESSGTTAPDLTPNNNDGTLTNMNPSTDWIPSTCPVGDAVVADQQDTTAIWAVNTSASSSGLLISDVSFLNNVGDDIVFGHDGGTGTSTSELPEGVSSRWSRMWYQDITDVDGDGGTVQLTFDFSEAGLGGTPNGTYALLARDGISGVFSVITTTTTLADDQVTFYLDVSNLQDGWYYTLGEAVPALTLTKIVDDDTPDPGQLITFTIAVSNGGFSNAVSALVSDTLASGLTFAGPVTLEGSSGTVATDADDLPTLASGLTITTGGLITITLPVTVDTSLEGGTIITNIAAVTSAKVTTPQANSAEVTVQNIAPAAVNDAKSTDEDTPVTISVLANDDDLNGDTLSVNAVGRPTYGSASTNGTTVTYTPVNRTADYTAVFTYTVSDGELTDTATVTVLAVADNDPPTAVSDAIAVNEGAKTANLHATLLSNDTDPDTDDSHDIVAVDTSATVGAVTFDDATDTLVYTASGFDSLAAGVIATDTFAYTMEDGGGGQATATVTVAVVGVDKDIYHVYLPFTARSYVSAPDLVVERIIATSDSMQLVIKNQGHVPVANEFWIDVYIDPDPIPTAVNQVWPYLCDEGLVWGITADVLPLLPGDAITLTIGDVFYVPEYSSVSWPLATDTPVYAQVDSADITTTYGAVLETHEIAGVKYNNISSTLSTADVTGLALPPANGTSRSSSLSGLPPRPYIPLSPSLPR